MVEFFLPRSAVVLLENHGNCSGHRRECGEGSQSTELDRSAPFYRDLSGLQKTPIMEIWNMYGWSIATCYN